MISHSRRCIFIHQRKAAGASIIRAFGFAKEDPHRHVFNDGVLSEKPRWAERARRYPYYLVFTVVRNPWERFISGWRYCTSTRERSVLEVLRAMPVQGHDHRHLTRQQTDLICDAQGRFVTDYIIRFEALQQGFTEVCRRVGQRHARLPHINATAHRPYGAYFCAEARALFAHHFARDIALLGYDFDSGG